ncbi:hypothetical protein [Antarcticimicrobium luteum]|uniref:hypothetical protein n=1 Tax=Antarcticimicrobium luteum TaxID=2547397 RepID=UPI001FE15874|nr:hypothetical protein [Antarcticimicrobium luteum]
MNGRTTKAAARHLVNQSMSLLGRVTSFLSARQTRLYKVRSLRIADAQAARMIDFAVSPGAFPVQIDPDQVFMAGHSLGGFTALALAGARYDIERLERFCEATPDELVCGIFADWDIAQTFEDRVQMQNDLSDGRIPAFAVLRQDFAAQDPAQQGLSRPRRAQGHGLPGRT